MSTLAYIRAHIVPLSSSGLLARLMVVSPELGLWARAAASFWAKSLQSVKERVRYVCVTNVLYVGNLSKSSANINILFLPGQNSRAESREQVLYTEHMLTGRSRKSTGVNNTVNELLQFQGPAGSQSLCPGTD